MKILFYFFTAFMFLSNVGEAYNTLQFSIVDDKITIIANKTHLHDILKKMTELGVDCQIDPEINPVVTVSFKNRDIRKALDALLKSWNHVLVYKNIQGPIGSISKLDKIHVFRPGKKELMQPIVSKRTLDVATNPKDGSLYVKQEILIRLMPKTEVSELKALLNGIGATILNSFPNLGIYKILLPKGTDIISLTKRLENISFVQKAEPNYAFRIAKPYHKNSLPEKNTSKNYPIASSSLAGVPIAVLDSGLSKSPDMGDVVLASFDPINNKETISDDVGHGTQMAYIASGLIAPYGKKTQDQVPIIPIKAFDDNGVTSNFILMDSIEFALQNGARILSLSWGSETDSDFLQETIEYAASNGLIIVAAAGNVPNGKNVYPAAYNKVVAVGALDEKGNVWKSSNYGKFIDVYAPGIADFPIGYKGKPGTYAGTSISTAFVANALSKYLLKKQELPKNLDDLFQK